jgi:hypothetical protein
MPFKATPQQAFLVFSLVFADTAERREPKQSDVKLAPKMREELVKAGLLSKEKRGRAQHLVITSKAYEKTHLLSAVRADVRRPRFRSPPFQSPGVKIALLAYWLPRSL